VDSVAFDWQAAGLLTTILAARRTDPSPHQVTGTPERTWAFFD
jgi:hypothetical protein